MALDDQPPSIARIALTLVAIVGISGLLVWTLVSIITRIVGPAPQPAKPAKKPPAPAIRSEPTQPVATPPSTAAKYAPPPPAAPSKKHVAVPFSTRSAMRHIRYLVEQIGVRNEGTASERRAADYIASKLKRYGYGVRVQNVPLMYGKTSRNVVAIKKGAGAAQMVLGAHYDSKGNAPGGNDNASGTGVVLELARVFRSEPTQPTIVFAFFGAEEMIDADPDHHHFGSRTYVRRLRSTQKSAIAGMISVDMVGYGTGFYANTMGSGPQALEVKLLSFAAKKRVPLTYRRDRGRYGWSDHEPFEVAGIPAVWLEWRDDPTYHSAADDAAHLDSRVLRKTGDLLQRFLLRLSIDNLAALAAANRN